MTGASYGFGRHLEALETLLVPALSLTPQPLPLGLERTQGAWREGVLTLEARAFSGPRIRYARFVIVRGPAIEIANALLFPAPGSGKPIFGADLVDLSVRGALAAIDLSPVSSGEVRAQQLSAIGRFVAHLPSLPPAGELPAWGARWFSPHGLFSRVAPGQGQQVGDALLAYGRAFLSMPQEPSNGTLAEADELALQSEYSRSHREGERGLQLLEKAFGRDWAGPFVDHVLFPESELPWTAPHNG